MSDEVWDAGLQLERTRLAWQRTSLAMMSAGLIIARIVGHHEIGLGVVIAAAVVIIAGATGVASTRRYRRTNRHLHDDAPLTGGVVHLLMTLAFLVVAAGGVTFTLLLAGG
ncbi:MAG: DUF202 domain-containing protein [Propionibacteriaceae bacterium]|nr:DUF202 domain-containing protein [Propionibacteriaceae bacterium]